MRRQGLYEPTIEDAIELSGIETLHPGGMALTRRTAEVAELAPGTHVLDVSSGRGTQSILYAEAYGARVTGLDLSPEMVATARSRAERSASAGRLRFIQGDSQALPFEDGAFDVVINECAVGIPDDSQRVLDEMARVVRPGGLVVIHESTWAKDLDEAERTELTERYGTTPLEPAEWIEMLERAGLTEVLSELLPWSHPENFWKVRQGRDVQGPGQVLTLSERGRTVWRILLEHGMAGVWTALVNERRFYDAVRAGKLGYGLFWAKKPE